MIFFLLFNFLLCNLLNSCSVVCENSVSFLTRRHILTTLTGISILVEASSIFLFESKVIYNKRKSSLSKYSVEFSDFVEPRRPQRRLLLRLLYITVC